MEFFDKRIFIPTLDHQNLEQVQRFDQTQFLLESVEPMVDQIRFLIHCFPNIFSSKAISDHEQMLYFFAKRELKKIEDCYQYQGIDQPEKNVFGASIQSLTNQCCLLKSIYERKNHSENPMVWNQIKMDILCQMESERKQLSIINFSYSHFDQIPENKQWIFVQETVSPKELKKLKSF